MLKGRSEGNPSLPELLNQMVGLGKMAEDVIRSLNGHKSEMLDSLLNELSKSPSY